MKLIVLIIICSLYSVSNAGLLDWFTGTTTMTTTLPAMTGEPQQPIEKSYRVKNALDRFQDENHRPPTQEELQKLIQDALGE